MNYPTYIEASYVTTPADKKPGRTYIEGILYDLQSPRLGESYIHYAVCANCDKIHKHHVQQKCLFEPTEFKFIYDHKFEFGIKEKAEFDYEQEQIQKQMDSRETEP